MENKVKGTVNRCDIKSGKTGFLRELKKHYQLLLMVLPGLAVFILFNYLPMFGVTIAFKDYRLLEGIFGSPWVGMKHFTKLFTGAEFPQVVRNTVVISLLKLVCGFPAPIILAFCINELKGKYFKKVIQTCSYLPHFFSWVVLSGIFTMLFSATGPINALIGMFGAEPLQVFSNSKQFIAMLVVTTVWQGMGWSSIIYLAALSGVDVNLYEAAKVDGAKKWHEVIYITLPSILPTIVTVFILNLSHVLNAGFDQVFNLYTPLVYEYSDIIDTYVMRRLSAMDYGIGSAAGLFKSIVGLIFVLTSNWVVKKLSDDELGIM